MTFVQKEQLRSKFKKRDRAEDHYNDNKIQVAGLLLGQCYDAMRHKLEGLGNWVVIKRNPVELMKAIKSQSFKYRENEYSGESAHRAINNFLNLKRMERQGVGSFLTKF